MGKYSTPGGTGDMVRLLGGVGGTKEAAVVRAGEGAVCAWVGEWQGAWIGIDAMARRCMARGRCERAFGGSGAAALPCA